jgi:hypothetical protein
MTVKKKIVAVALKAAAVRERVALFTHPRP